MNEGKKNDTAIFKCKNDQKKKKKDVRIAYGGETVEEEVNNGKSRDYARHLTYAGQSPHMDKASRTQVHSHVCITLRTCLSTHECKLRTQA